jgi:hypothetical protein
MTAPDPRPYAAPGDLVTAADVARWLRERAAEWRADARAHPEVGARLVRLDYGGAVTLDDALADLRARLDRERRQACERGWQAHAAASRQRGRQAREARQKGWTEWAAQRERERAHHMARALAFRAAARQP